MKKRKIISAQLSDEVKEGFEAIARKSGLGEAWWASQLIERLVDSDNELFFEIWAKYTDTIKASKGMAGNSRDAQHVPKPKTLRVTGPEELANAELVKRAAKAARSQSSDHPHSK